MIRSNLEDENLRDPTTLACAMRARAFIRSPCRYFRGRFGIPYELIEKQFSMSRTLHDGCHERSMTH